MTHWLQHRYLLLGTRRRDGRMVDTPVWFALEDGVFYLFSNANAGKVKRLRNFDSARITPCTVTGKPLGAAQPARAHLLEDPADQERALNALRRRYGWQMWMVDAGARLSGRFHQRACIAVVPETDTDSPGGTHHAAIDR